MSYRSCEEKEDDKKLEEAKQGIDTAVKNISELVGTKRYTHQYRACLLSVLSDLIRIQGNLGD